MASTTFSGPVTSTNGFVGAVTGNVTGNVTGFVDVPVYTVATAPDASGYSAGTIIVITDGNAGAGTLAYSDGTNWIASASGATAASS